MLFALLCYADETKLAGVSREDMTALVERHVQYDYEEIRTTEPGRVLAERWLQPLAQGVTVRAGEVAPAGPDGPEVLTMLYLLNCESRDEAIELAGRYPWLDYGRVDVRPITGEWDYTPTVDSTASASAVWDVLSDLTTWSAWFPAAAEVHLDGPLAAGLAGSVRTATGQIRPIRIVSVVPGCSFVTESDVGGDVVVRVEHSVTPHETGSRIAADAVIPRAALDVLGMDFSKAFNQSLRDSLRSLTTLAEGTPM
jgi:hypothetical protein